MKGVGEVRNLRKVPHALVAVEYLREIGASDISVTQKGHLHIRWSVGGRVMSISLSCTPRVSQTAVAQTAKQLIRRRFRENGIALAQGVS